MRHSPRPMLRPLTSFDDQSLQWALVDVDAVCILPKSLSRSAQRDSLSTQS